MTATSPPIASESDVIKLMDQDFYLAQRSITSCDDAFILVEQISSL
jgi:hypothetical protein